MAFDNDIRNKLARMVADARTLLVREFTDQLQEAYGIQPNGTVTPVEKLTHLDDERRDVAELLRERVDHLASGLSSEKKPVVAAIDRLMREQAFTILNRFAALRMCEERGIVQECVRGGLQSKGFQLYLKTAGAGLGDTYDRYRTFILCLFDELAIDLGVLFDRFAPGGMLFPREPALIKLFGILNQDGLRGIWSEDETIGWIYQYFNSKEEREKMRKASAAPRNSRELAVRNQFFTPRYVVEFLTDNTLGRTWYEMTRGQTRLVDECDYLVRRPNEIFLKEGDEAPERDEGDDADMSQEELLKQPVYIPYRAVKDPRTILMLDPACGSMHFGLYAFDLYEVIYEEAWDLEEARGADALTRPEGMKSLHECYADKQQFIRDVPRLIIEGNIHGIDIDPRCAQIAGLSLWLRAQRNWQTQGIKPVERPRITKSNIVCAEPMPGEKDMLAEFIGKLGKTNEGTVIGQLVEIIWDKMQLAGEAGSLLKIEEELSDAIAEARKMWEILRDRRRDVLPGMEDQFVPQQGEFRFDVAGVRRHAFWDDVEQRVLDSLHDFAESVTDGRSYQRRLFADDSAQGFAFIDVCRKRYDVVLMNPPFGLAPSSVKRLVVEKEYPEGKSDLASAFVQMATARGAKGKVGALTTRVLLTLPTYEAWRRAFCLGKWHVEGVADLGFGVLDGALVEAAAYVVGEGESRCAPCVSCLETEAKEDRLRQRCQELQAGRDVADLYVARPDLFRHFPAGVFAYMTPPSIAAQMVSWQSLDQQGVTARKGLNTSDDQRFLRTFWEVPPQGIGEGMRWVPFAKGGEWNPFWDDIHLLVDWRTEGREILVSGGTLRNLDTYFRAGLTYPERTTSSFGPRVLPAGCIYSTAGMAVHFRQIGDAPAYMGLLLSRPGQMMVEISLGGGDSSVSGTAARHYTNGMVNRLPLPRLTDISRATLCEPVALMAHLKRRGFRRDETSREFCVDWLRGGVTIQMLCQEHLSEEGRGFSDQFRAAAQIEATALDLFALSHPESLGFLARSASPPFCDDVGSCNEQRIAELLELDEFGVIELFKEAIGAGARYITKNCQLVSRKYELISHLVRVAPERVLSVQLSAVRQGRVPSERVAQTCRDVLSSGFGVLLGRWDVAPSAEGFPQRESRELFDPLPPCSPGMLRRVDGLAAESEDVAGDYPIEIPWSGIVVDDPSHSWDTGRRFRDFLAVIWGDQADAIEREVCEILGLHEIREYFGNPNKFFDDHLNRHSKSRRQAPIYWPLSTASGSYLLWIYYHRLNDQTLFTCVTDFVDPKIDEVTKDIDRLQRDMADSGTPKQREELEQLQDFRQELIEFRDELLRVTKLPYKPDLNDGVIITASPLHKLFRHRKWSKDLEATWNKLEAGDYEWAHLAMPIWPDRVVRACHNDRSLAIAHDLEDEFWEEVEVKDKRGKTKTEWRPKDVSEEQLASLVEKELT